MHANTCTKPLGGLDTISVMGLLGKVYASAVFTTNTASKKAAGVPTIRRFLAGLRDKDERERKGDECVLYSF